LERRPERDAHGELDHRHAGHLGQERNGPRRTGVHLDQVDAVLPDDELGVEQAAHAEGACHAFDRGHDQALIAVADGARREDADRVARVDARAFDMLEKTGHEDSTAIGDGIDVHLDPFEVVVDAHRAVEVDRHGGLELPAEIVRRPADVDGQPTDDERRTDDDRVADPLGHGVGLLQRVRHPAVRLRDPEAFEKRRETGPLLGLIDRVEVRPEERHARRDQRPGQRKRRLSPVRDDRRHGNGISLRRRVGGAFRGDDFEHALGVERLEVEAGRGVEVGGDRLGIGVDHDRRPAMVTQRPGRMHGAVVELDSLADPHGAAPDDDRGGAGDRRRFGIAPRGRVRRVEVGRLRGELRGGRVDHRVPRPQSERVARRRELVPREAREMREVGVAEPCPLRRREERHRLRIGGVDEASSSCPNLRFEGEVALQLRDEPRRDPRRGRYRIGRHAAA
jgi:hypothetical protein